MILGIGTDIVSIKRIESLIDKHGADFLNKIFTPSEIIYCGQKIGNTKNYAVRFAAKEAMSKALGTGIGENCNWKDVEVVNEDNGFPQLKIYNNTKNYLESKYRISENSYKIHISLAHEDLYAIAYVLIETI